MDMKDIPDRRRRRYSRKLTVKIENETAERLDALRADGKDVPTFLRTVIAKAVGTLKRGG